MKVNVYIDGFNFYYGVLKGTSYKWLDLHKLFYKSILPSVGIGVKPEDLIIKYFTADILERAVKSSDSLTDQQNYHHALKGYIGDNIEIIKGYYSLKKTHAYLFSEEHRSNVRESEKAVIWSLEEKQSDVNLGLTAYRDSIQAQRPDVIVIVTNDTDLASCIRFIKQDAPDVQTVLVNPTRDNRQRRPNKKLADALGGSGILRKNISEGELKLCQLPDVVKIPGKKNRQKRRPESWSS